MDEIIITAAASSSFSWMTFISVAIAVALADVCWTMYFIETSNKNAVKAGVWSSLIMLCSAFAVSTYVGEKIYIGAAIVGAFVGTWATIKFHNKK